MGDFGDLLFKLTQFAVPEMIQLSAFEVKLAFRACSSGFILGGLIYCTTEMET